jgi:hypothetical protein
MIKGGVVGGTAWSIAYLEITYVYALSKAVLPHHPTFGVFEGVPGIKVVIYLKTSTGFESR